MKAQLLILITAVLAFTAGQTTLPPSPTPDPTFECPSDSDGYYPHPDDCTKYYECTNGLAWLFICPDGLYFDPISNLCNWPDLVDCDHGPTRAPQPRGQEIIGPAENYTCTENGAWPHEELCEYYYDCWEGNAMLGRCTEGYLFDLIYMGCNFPQNVDCEDRIRPNGTDPTTTKGPTTTAKACPTKPPHDVDNFEDFVCPNPDGLFVDPGCCSFFFQCVGSIPFRNECPDKLVFNSKGYCDYVSNVPSCQ